MWLQSRSWYRGKRIVNRNGKEGKSLVCWKLLMRKKLAATSCELNLISRGVGLLSHGPPEFTGELYPTVKQSSRRKLRRKCQLNLKSRCCEEWRKRVREGMGRNQCWFVMFDPRVTKRTIKLKGCSKKDNLAQKR